MIDTVAHFFAMGGYGVYIWSAYGSVFAFLSMQYFFTQRKWLRYLKQQKPFQYIFHSLTLHPAKNSHIAFNPNSDADCLGRRE